MIDGIGRNKFKLFASIKVTPGLLSRIGPLAYNGLPRHLADRKRMYEREPLLKRILWNLRFFFKSIRIFGAELDWQWFPFEKISSPEL